MLLGGALLIASLTVAGAFHTYPQGVRVVIGVLMVFVTPGFALVCAVVPKHSLSDGERALASVGLSLAIVTCGAVLLAALPIGLSAKSFAVAIGSLTIVCAACGLIRTFAGAEATTRRGDAAR